MRAGGGTAMLYTVVPLEDVLGWDGPEASRAPEAEAEVEVAGRRLVARPDGEGVFRLVRLVSTDPLDYLDPRLQPGAVLSRRLCSR